jgi:hypothetical protein
MRAEFDLQFGIAQYRSNRTSKRVIADLLDRKVVVVFPFVPVTADIFRSADG